MDFYFHIRNLLLFLFFVYIIQNKSTFVNINIKNIYNFIFVKSIEEKFGLCYNKNVGVLQNTPFIDFLIAFVYNVTHNSDFERIRGVWYMIKKYNKLVRDKIPQIIEENGQMCETEILSDERYLEMLELKLSEECTEYQIDKDVEVLADILEVVYAIANAKGVTDGELDRIRLAKANKNGRYKDKIYIKEVTEW